MFNYLFHLVIPHVNTSFKLYEGYSMSLLSKN
jgi:hypothetical protein